MFISQKLIEVSSVRFKDVFFSQKSQKNSGNRVDAIDGNERNPTKIIGGNYYLTEQKNQKTADAHTAHISCKAKRSLSEIKNQKSNNSARHYHHKLIWQIIVGEEKG